MTIDICKMIDQAMEASVRADIEALQKRERQERDFLCYQLGPMFNTTFTHEDFHETKYPGIYEIQGIHIKLETFVIHPYFGVTEADDKEFVDDFIIYGITLCPDCGRITSQIKINDITSFYKVIHHPNQICSACQNKLLTHAERFEDYVARVSQL